MGASRGNDGMGQLFDTDAFYRESCDAGFVKLGDIARNVAWTTATPWGVLEITVNLSKPEKDPRAIAAAAREPGLAGGAASYIDPATGAARPCPLCVTQADVELGYARPIRICGERWALWYSPYAYYEEHCIAMSWEHRPMHIDRAAFAGLFDAVDAFPRYFFGSNADLPIVGGSILGHDHFQGGRHLFPMQLAPISQAFELPAFPDIAAGIVRWPVSVVRLEGASRASLVEAACAILDVWQAYDDPTVGIVSGVESAGGEGEGASPQKVHNTITPLLRRSESGYQLDLALRCNVTSGKHPLGVFHPHEDLHHIKKENIGLIEVMGLAILPPRVLRAMDERGLSRDDVGLLFARVLEDAGVFKWNGQGIAAFRRFVCALGGRMS